MKNKNIWLSLLQTFMKVGLFTFGGGYAMIALIDSECVDKKEWITSDELMDVTAIAESTPGPIAINCATYVGYKQAGFWGSLIATFGIVFPSFMIMYIVSMFLDHFLEISIIASAFKGIKVAVGILILSAGIKMLQKMIRQMKKQGKKLPLVFMVCGFLVMLIIDIFTLDFSTFYLILIAGALGFLLFRKGGAIKKRGAIHNDLS